MSNLTPSNAVFCAVESYYNTTYGSSRTLGLRPCFSLKSDIEIIGNGGKTADTAYIIN